MILTKTDLQAIDKIVTKRVQPLEKGQTKLEKGQKRIEKKFDKLFNFLDRDLSTLKRKVDRFHPSN